MKASERRQPRCVNPERGAAAVEFALVLPVFLLLVLGSIDWGYYFYVDQVVTNAVREAARTGAVADDDGSGTLCTSQAEARLTEYLQRGALMGALTNTDPVECGGANCPDINGATAVCVKAVYPVGSITGFLKLSSVELVPAAAVSRAVMRVEW